MFLAGLVDVEYHEWDHYDQDSEQNRHRAIVLPKI
jgi:hypothetical protein